MKETLDSIAYKNHHNLDDKFNDYQSKNLCFNIKFASHCNMSKPCPCSLSSKSHRDTIYNTINSCRRINDKLNEISILHDQKGLNKMNE